MQKVLDEIRNGQFATAWVQENKDGQPKFNELRKAAAAHPIEEVGAQLRAMMPFMKSGRPGLKDVSGG